MDWSDENENALDSIRVNREFDSTEIDVSDLHLEKQDEPRIWILHAISRCDNLEKFRIHLWSITSIGKACSQINLSVSDSIK
jgi:hypothetical protein